EQGGALSGKAPFRLLRSIPGSRKNERGRCDEHRGNSDQHAQPRAAHFLFATLLLLVSSPDAPGATPSSASGSLGSFAEACWVALVSSRPARVITEAIKTIRKTKARLVSPMRMRCALLPGWYGIASTKLCPTSTICKRTTLTVNVASRRAR